MKPYLENTKRYLVLNPDTNGHRIVDTLEEAMELTDQYPSFRYYGMKGEIEVDDKLLAFIKWATDPSESLRD